MNIFFEAITKKLDRKKSDILFGEHAAKDKNLNQEDVKNVISTARYGKIDEFKSSEIKKRICFKNYFDEKNNTYFVVVDYKEEFIKIITVIKKKGKY